MLLVKLFALQLAWFGCLPIYLSAKQQVFLATSRLGIVYAELNCLNYSIGQDISPSDFSDICLSDLDDDLDIIGSLWPDETKRWQSLIIRFFIRFVNRCYGRS